MTPVQVATKSPWICSICYAIPNDIVTTRWHCSLIGTSKDPLVSSNYIIVGGKSSGCRVFRQRLSDDVVLVVKSITAHAEKGARTKTTLYVGQEKEDDEGEEQGHEVGGGGARMKDKPHHPLLISVQKVRIRPGKGEGKPHGRFPHPLTNITRRVCTEDPETKLIVHSLCATREWECDWYGVTTPTISSG